jgi:FemAB-related protein (PEP-CTERM system-associated)
MTMNIRHCDDTPIDAQRWDAYVQRAPEATSDHLWGWRRVLRDAFGFAPYSLAAVEGDRVVGVLPLFRVPRGVRHCALSSIPFGNYGGICADTPEAARALLDEAKVLMARLGADSIDLRHRVPMDEPSLQQPGRGHSRFVLPLAEDPAVHLQQMGQNNRSKIARAGRKGLTWEVSQELDDLYAIYLHSSRRQGTPSFPRRYFEGIVREFAPATRIIYVKLGERRIAFDFVLVFKDSAVCQFSGSLSQYYECYPNEWLYWSAIQDGCSLKLKELDFCRSRLGSGTADFKRKLRFREEPLDYQYYLPNERLSPTPQVSARERYGWVIRTWQRMPLWMTQHLGPVVLKYLG